MAERKEGYWDPQTKKWKKMTVPDDVLCAYPTRDTINKIFEEFEEDRKRRRKDRKYRRLRVGSQAPVGVSAERQSGSVVTVLSKVARPIDFRSGPLGSVPA